MLTQQSFSKLLLLSCSLLLFAIHNACAQSAQAPAAPAAEPAAKPVPPPKPVSTVKPAPKPKPPQPKPPTNTTQKPAPVNTIAATPAKPPQKQTQAHPANNNAAHNNQVTMNPLGVNTNNLLAPLNGAQQRTPPLFYEANPAPAAPNNGAAVNNAANSLENAAGNAFTAATTTLANAGTAVANTAASTLNGANNAANHYSNSRGILPTQGMGDFRREDFTLTAYSCYRSGSRVLCDFDVSKAAAAESNTSLFSNVAIVDDGGRITHRKDAYFMGTDGARLANAYISASPVRYIMEFDDPTNSTLVSLVCGDERIQNVPVNVSTPR